METLRHLIKFFLRIAVAFFLIAIVWGLVHLLFPDLDIRTIIPKIMAIKKKATAIRKKNFIR